MLPHNPVLTPIPRADNSGLGETCHCISFSCEAFRDFREAEKKEHERLSKKTSLWLWEGGASPRLVQEFPVESEMRDWFSPVEFGNFLHSYTGVLPIAGLRKSRNMFEGAIV